MTLASTSVHVVEGAPINGCCQCLCPRGAAVASCLSGSLSKISVGSDPGSFQITASALGPGARGILCVPFKSGVFISHCPLGLPKEALLAFKAKYSGGSSSLSRTPGLGRPMLGLDPLFLRKNLCNILLFMRHPPGGVGLDYMAPPNPPISLWFLLCIFSCRRSFLVGSRFYHLCLLFWRVCERT